MKTVALAFSLMVSTLGAGRALGGETIRLKPGQCILIGSQEVCAMRPDDPAAVSAPAAPRPTMIASCKYGDRADAEGMKGYTLFRIGVKDDGTKAETAVKTYGSMPADKAECERDAERLDRRSP